MKRKRYTNFSILIRGVFLYAHPHTHTHTHVEIHIGGAFHFWCSLLKLSVNITPNDRPGITYKSAFTYVRPQSCVPDVWVTATDTRIPTSTARIHIYTDIHI